MAEETNQDAQRRADAQAKADAASARVAAAKQAQADSQAKAKPEVTKSANEPLSVKANGEARAKAVATNRWATIKHVEEANDPDNSRDEVIVISIMEAGPPEVDAALTEDDNEVAEHYTYQQVGPGVMIGMRRGGEFGSVDGFGWKDKEEMAAHASPVDVKPRTN